MNPAIPTHCVPHTVYTVYVHLSNPKIADISVCICSDPVSPQDTRCVPILMWSVEQWPLATVDEALALRQSVPGSKIIGEAHGAVY